MRIKREDRPAVALNIGLLIFTIIFFTVIYPVLPYSGDDWYFSGAMRLPWPMWGVFNPSKVLPEVLEPLGGYIAAFTVSPLTGDYVGAIGFVQATVISVFITAFCWNLFRYLRVKFELTSSFAFVSELLMFATFFLIFKEKNRDSFFAFWSFDLNCFFNYAIPGLLNASMVLYMDRQENITEKFKSSGNLGKSLFILGIYFSLFSSIQESIILAGYVFFKAIFVFAKKRSFKDIIIYIAIDLLWLVTLIFELNGRRAGVLQKDSGSFFILPLKEVLKQMKSLYSRASVTLIVIFIAVTVISCLLIFIDRKIREKFGEVILGSFLMLALTSVFLFLLYAKTGGNYGSRPDAMFAVTCTLLLFNIFNIVTVFSKAEPVRFLLYLGLFAALLTAFNLNGKFALPQSNLVDRKLLDEYIIAQVVEADKNNAAEVEVHVPKHQPESNYPHPYNLADWLQNTLYSHNIISNRIKITIVPDEEVNKIFFKESMKTIPFKDLEVP